MRFADIIQQMIGLDDHELLAEYARTKSETAFGVLVARYVNLVYSAALRFTGNPHHAEEITQAAFIILAHKAGRLRRGTVLSGWLYQTARLTAANFVKGEIRRQSREQEAYMQSTLTEMDADAWKQIAPLLDEAMGRLGETDRNAVVLRYFENKTAQEIATSLKLNEAAAHKRVTRGLEKLRKYFVKRGVTLSATVIAGAVTTNSVQAAPVGLAVTVTTAAAKGAVIGGSTLTLVKGALKIMAWTKAQTAIVVGAGVLLTAGTVSIAIKEIQEQKTYSWQVPMANMNVMNNTSPQVVIVPTIFTKDGGRLNDYGREGGAMGICQSITNVVRSAYPQDIYRMVFSTGLPDGRYDFFAKIPDSALPLWQGALQEKLKSELGITGRREVREADVLLLRFRNPNTKGFQPSDSLRRSMNLPEGYRETIGTNSITWFVSPISSLQSFLQTVLEIPIIDRTGNKNFYDFRLTWDQFDRTQSKENLKQALLDQLGLELVPGREPVEMLVVEKVK